MKAIVGVSAIALSHISVSVWALISLGGSFLWLLACL
ncbi:MAG: hypothetical protein ACI87W_003461, partial [Halieaceae bacterium]